jgi:hypothetical protein
VASQAVVVTSAVLRSSRIVTAVTGVTAARLPAQILLRDGDGPVTVGMTARCSLHSPSLILCHHVTTAETEWGYGAEGREAPPVPAVPGRNLGGDLAHA